MRITFLALTLLGGRWLSGGQWPMFGGNPQRDGWARDETVLTKDNVKSMKLLWKVRLENVPKELNSLTAPIIIENPNSIVAALRNAFNDKRNQGFTI